MTPLARIIAAQIHATGPISLSEYMRICLLHSEHGYYATRDPFGTKGDFTTAPEISQIYGELLGLALAQVWLDQGRPAPFALAEIGPGRGTLMADVLRAIRVVPGMTDAAQVFLVEASPHLRQVQRDCLGAVTHLDTASDLPDMPLFLLANEFFDALPIQQFQRVEGGWAERLVSVQGDALVMGLGPVLPGRDAPMGEVLERCPEALPVMREIAGRIARHGGAAIIVDYGGWNGRGDTFQALRGHAPDDPLANPGEADLTAHVDFAPLAAEAHAAGAQISALTTQGALLAALGVQARAARLLAAGDQGVGAAVHRLTAPDQMGQLFKALAVWPRGAPPVPGFAALRTGDENDA